MKFIALREPPPVTPDPPPGDGQKTIQNLLAHIPAEASGFYLMAIGLITKQQYGASLEPNHGQALLLGGMALVILVLVRWLAHASVAVHVTTIGAFAIWMSVIENGFLHLNGIAMPSGLGFVFALFYSTVITLLANAGKLK
jgi:hypothetical protein